MNLFHAAFGSLSGERIVIDKCFNGSDYGRCWGNILWGRHLDERHRQPRRDHPLWRKLARDQPTRKEIGIRRSPPAQHEPGQTQFTVTGSLSVCALLLRERVSPTIYFKSAFLLHSYNFGTRENIRHAWQLCREECPVPGRVRPCSM